MVSTASGDRAAKTVISRMTRWRRSRGLKDVRVLLPPETLRYLTELARQQDVSRQRMLSKLLLEALQKRQRSLSEATCVEDLLP